MLSIVRSAVPSLRHFQKDLRVLALHGCGNPSAIRCILAVGLRIFHDDLLRLLSRYNAPTLRCVASTVAKYPCGKGGTNRAEHYCVLLRTASGGAEWLQRMNTGATPLNVFDLPKQASDPGDKAHLLRMAQAWRDLADKAENPRAQRKD